jgi:hypothetical protein
MAFTTEQLAAKIRGTITALSRLSVKERLLTPGQKFAQDYNTLREQMLAAKPELQGLLPPTVEFQEHGVYCDANYGEIEAYCEQLLGMLRA